jgi:hypothetical protein
MAIQVPLLAKPERRRWTRYWFNGAVKLTRGNRRIDGLGIQVSRGGIYLFAIADLPIGTEIIVTFTEPRSERQVEVPGTVRHRAVYLYGVEFLIQHEEGSAVTGLDRTLDREAAPHS